MYKYANKIIIINYYNYTRYFRDKNYRSFIIISNKLQQNKY